MSLLFSSSTALVPVGTGSTTSNGSSSSSSLNYGGSTLVASGRTGRLLGGAGGVSGGARGSLFDGPADGGVGGVGGAAAGGGAGAGVGDFRELLERSLALNIHAHTDIPPMQHDFDQLLEGTEALAAENKRDVAEHEYHIRGNRLLAGHNFDVEKLQKYFRAADFRGGFEPVDDTATDVDSFLRHHHDMMIGAAIEEAKESTFRLCDEALEKQLQQDWDSSRDKLMTALGLGMTSRPPATTADGTAPLALMPPAGPVWPVRRASSFQAPENASKFASVVASLVATNRPQDAVTQLHHLVTSEELATKPAVLACWDLMYHMLCETGLEANTASRSPMLKHRLARGALRFLERRAATLIQTFSPPLTKNRRVDGPVQVAAAIGTFLDSKREDPDWSRSLRNSSVVDGRPFWPKLFYCLRCGALDDAISVTEKYVAVRATSHVLLQGVRAYVAVMRDQAIPIDLGATIKALRNGTGIERQDASEPFQTEVMRILSFRIPKDDSANELVYPKLQDFMWQRLVFAVLTPFAEAASESYAIEKLADTIRRLGPAYFDPEHRQPYKYVQTLFLCGEFEEAIAYLATCDPSHLEFRDAVHMALAFYLSQVLQVAPYRHDEHARHREGLALGNDYLVAPDRLDLALLLHDYVYQTMRLDRPEDSVSAANYFILLRDEAARISLLVQLLEASSSHDELVGALHSNLAAAQGHLQRYMNRRDVPIIISAAAHKFRARGDALKAVTLFARLRSAEGLKDVLSTLLTELSPLAPKAAEIEGPRQHWYNIAVSVFRDFVPNVMRADVAPSDPLVVVVEQQMKSLQVLLRLFDFFDQIERSNYQAAWEAVESMNLFDPRTTADFVELDNCVLKLFDRVIFDCMRCLLVLGQNARAENDLHMRRSIIARAEQVASFRERVLINLRDDPAYRVHQLLSQIRGV